MRRTITRRRTTIESALRTHLPEAFDRSPEELLELDRPRLQGQVFLALVDGFGHDRPLEDVVPIAAALELVSLQRRLHRVAVDQSRRTGDHPTDDVLVGDLLESKAFELTTGFDAEPELVERCFAVLVEATRSTQEGEWVLTAPKAESETPDRVDDRRLGAVTGCAAEIAALIADIDSHRELARKASALGVRVRRYRDDGRLPADRERFPADRSAWIEPILESCPPTARAPVRDQLSAILAESLDREPTDPIA
ncbi:polyprenyl synthetase family protein [Natronococcus occultus]|uniref:dimethylallyltranstransferase / geranyltranstransferase n=1 Tax=Natronococcus occultus TaxID=29288 RepID=UPI0006779EC0|nr:dimethylallyltranstransferase / geranyltranstransferase [Natronococcus occultus]